jgi:hypothetical protein
MRSHRKQCASGIAGCRGLGRPLSRSFTFQPQVRIIRLNLPHGTGLADKHPPHLSAQDDWAANSFWAPVSRLLSHLPKADSTARRFASDRIRPASQHPLAEVRTNNEF